MKSSIVLIFNPIAQRASEKKIIRASHFLRSKGYKVEVLFTKQKGDAETLAREAIKESPLLIIAAGGDGTFNEVINGLAGSEIPMAILPLGTTNVLAKEIGVPRGIEGAMEFALAKTSKSISLGKISRHFLSEAQSSSIVTRYFILMAGIGFDGEAVYGINEALKKISGKGAYIYSGFRTLSGFDPGELVFEIDGKAYSGYSAVIGNAAKYGGNFKITPHAKLTDPNLYVCIFKGKKRLDILRYVSGIVLGWHLRFKDITHAKATTIEVKGDAHIQIDGDYFGKTPAKIEIVPDIVRIVL